MREKNLFFYEMNRCERNRKNWVRVVEKCARFCVSVRFLLGNQLAFASISLDLNRRGKIPDASGVAAAPGVS